MRYCQSKSLPIFPGCTTPTDYHTAYKLGLEVLKFFGLEPDHQLAEGDDFRHDCGPPLRFLRIFCTAR